MKLVVFLISLGFFIAASLWGEEAKKAIEVFPSTPFYQYIIYETLVIFWITIIGLLVIIRMKLREIERVQKLGLDTPGRETPLPDDEKQTTRDNAP